jgi:hypothetical protein
VGVLIKREHDGLIGQRHHNLARPTENGASTESASIKGCRSPGATREASRKQWTA